MRSVRVSLQACNKWRLKSLKSSSLPWLATPKPRIEESINPCSCRRRDPSPGPADKQRTSTAPITTDRRRTAFPLSPAPVNIAISISQERKDPSKPPRQSPQSRIRPQAPLPESRSRLPRENTLQQSTVHLPLLHPRPDQTPPNATDKRLRAAYQRHRQQVVVHEAEEEGCEGQVDEVESEFLAGRHDVEACVYLVAVVEELGLVADFAGRGGRFGAAGEGGGRVG